MHHCHCQCSDERALVIPECVCHAIPTMGTTACYGFMKLVIDDKLFHEIDEEDENIYDSSLRIGRPFYEFAKNSIHVMEPDERWKECAEIHPLDSIKDKILGMKRMLLDLEVSVAELNGGGFLRGLWDIIDLYLKGYYTSGRRLCTPLSPRMMMLALIRPELNKLNSGELADLKEWLTEESSIKDGADRDHFLRP